MTRSIPVDELLRGCIYQWAYRLLANHHDALDATHDVLVRYLAADERMRNPRAWLRRATVNRCIDFYRHRRRAQAGMHESLPRHVGAEALPDGADAQRDIHADIARRLAEALGGLSEQQRTVIIARTFDDESFPQIADSMGISINSVKTHYVRGLRMLRRQLHGDEELNT